MRTQQIRDVLYLDCQIKSDPEVSPKKSLEWFAEKFELLYGDRAKNTQWSRNKKQKIYLRDFIIEDRVLWLLLYANDANASDASFAHLETDDHRDVAKGVGEGRPESAHIALSLDHVAVKPFRYLALAEASAMLPRSRVERYLNHLIRQVKRDHPDQFKEPHKNGAKNADGEVMLVKYANSVSLKGHLSDEFKQQVEKGHLTGIALETSEQGKIGFGEGQLLKPVKKLVKLAVHDSWKEKAKAIVAEALKMGKKNGLETARITFLSDDNSPHTVLLDTETGDVLNDGYVKTYRLDALGVDLPEASTAFSPHIKARMKILLDEENNVAAG